MTRYQFVGSQDPADRLDRVVDGAKTLVLNGDPVSLSEQQYERISRFARLVPVGADEEQVSEEQPKVTSGRSPAALKSESKEA